MTAAMPPRPERIASVRVRGIRTAADTKLACEPMTVLIGPNGVGKSTLIEALELLHKIPSSSDFIRALNEEHGGPSQLMRRGETEITLDVGTTDGASALLYQLTLARRNGSFAVTNEWLRDSYGGEPVFVRDGDTFVMDDEKARPAPKGPLLGTLTAFHPVIARVAGALAGIEVHVPFATQARWFGAGMVPERNMRADNIVQSTGSLDRGGSNLANAFHALRNRADWADTLETIRLVVDGDILDVTTPASASGGSIGLAATYRATGSVPAFALSDGTLALLALIAITRLDADGTRSLLVLDEPDLHLHPGAIGQVVALLEDCGTRQPVVIATHSDRVLDSLTEPARATVLCDLDERRQLRLRRPDQAQLDRWLEDFRGIGHLRAEGYDRLVFPAPRTAEKA